MYLVVIVGLLEVVSILLSRFLELLLQKHVL